MNFARQYLAALVLGAWLLAIGHVGLEHCAAMSAGCAVHCAAAEESHHEGDGDGHHHHFMAWAGQSAKASHGERVWPVWVRLDATDIGKRGTTPHETTVPAAARDSWESPPDGRASGWLLGVRTAHPVRGPALAA